MPNANSIMLAWLDSELGRKFTRTTVTLRYTAPKSGKRVELPVWAAKVDADWLVAVGWAEKKTWFKAFRRPLDAIIVHRGDEHPVTGRLASGPERETALSAYLAELPRARRTMKGQAPVVVFTPRGRAEL